MSDFSIDDRFARFGSTRYAIDKITSFSVSTRQERAQGQNSRKLFASGGFFGSIVGCIMARIGHDAGDQATFFGGCAVILAGCGLLWKARKMPSDGSTKRTLFCLLIVTNAGEVVAFETASLAEMDDIESALEQAIIDSRR
ncbi:DUF6232 family protein [Sphingomonas sp. 8AM]|uniref:DUF6232 family protein n=1 Tax=Sphingomonas sp. 8AM TaxID=2653170 RepID=UPI0013570C43|nr:DUF6232 family protein [Sphingomonas sp. 8AM]